MSGEKSLAPTARSLGRGTPGLVAPPVTYTYSGANSVVPSKGLSTTTMIFGNWKLHLESGRGLRPRKDRQHAAGTG